MCQIFAGNAKQIRGVLLDTYGLLADLYASNPHGLGVMYPSTKHGLRIRKVVPKNVAEARQFITQLPDDERNLVMHFRWKTSGNVDHDNAHPFIVLPRQMAMTHNGVLSISTKSDETKCDSRHYIDRVLHPQLAKFPELVAVDEWRDLIGEDIGGSNRFVFMDAKGEMHFVNKHTGIEHNGMWIANTYSFDASLLIPGYKAKSKTHSWNGSWGGHGYATLNWGKSQYDLDDSLYGAMGYEAGTAEAEDEADEEEYYVEDLYNDMEFALAECDPEFMAGLIEDYPLATFQYLFDNFRFVPSVDPATEMSGDDQNMAKLLTDADVNAAARLVQVNPGRARHLAEVCCWYGDWVPLARQGEPLTNEMYAA